MDYSNPMDMAQLNEIDAVLSFGNDLARYSKEIETQYSFTAPDGDATIALSVLTRKDKPDHSVYTCELRRLGDKFSSYTAKFNLRARLIGQESNSLDGAAHASIIAKELLEMDELGVDLRSILRYLQIQTLNMQIGPPITDSSASFKDGSDTQMQRVTNLIEHHVVVSADKFKDFRSYEHVLDSDDTLQVRLNSLSGFDEDEVDEGNPQIQIIYENRKNELRYTLTKTYAGKYGLIISCTDAEFYIAPDPYADIDYIPLGDLPRSHHIRKLSSALIEAYLHEFLSRNSPA